jgi:hypothetical protein
MRNKQQIIKFISAVNNKNYHSATKYIQAIVEANVKHKIASAVKTTTLF